MRPTTEEMIAGVRRVLSDVVEPDLQSSFARDQLAHLLLTLSQFDFEHVTLGLLEENRALVSVLTACAHGRTPLHADVERALEALAVDAHGSLTLADIEPDAVRQRNQVARGALEAVIRATPLWGEAGDVVLREVLLDHLRRFPGGGYWRPGRPRHTRETPPDGPPAVISAPSPLSHDKRKEHI